MRLALVCDWRWHGISLVINFCSDPTEPRLGIEEASDDP